MKDAMINVRMSSELKKKIKDIAKKEHRTLSQQIVKYLTESVK